MKRWTRQSDTLLVAHAMTLDEVAELLGRTEAECLARAEELGVDLTTAVVETSGILLQLHHDLVGELTSAAEKSNEPLPAFCRRMVRMGFASYVPDERLPELPDAAEIQATLDQCGHYLGIGAMDKPHAEAIAKRVLLQLLRGSIEQARLALEDGWASHARENEPLPIGPALLDEPMSCCLDDLRVLNSLEQEGILTVGQFLERGDGAWIGIVGVGNKNQTKLQNLSQMLRQRSLKEVA